MNPPGHERSAASLLAAYRRATGPADEAALLRAIVGRIVEDEGDVSDDASDDDVAPSPVAAPSRWRRTLPAVAAVGFGLAAALALILSLEGRSVEAEDDARRYQASDGAATGPFGGKVWPGLRDAATPEGDVPPTMSEPTSDEARVPHRDAGTIDAGPEPAPSAAGSSRPARTEPSATTPMPATMPTRAGAGTGWPGWPDPDDRDPARPPSTGVGGGWPGGTGSGGAPEPHDDAGGRNDGDRGRADPTSQPRAPGGSTHGDGAPPVPNSPSPDSPPPPDEPAPPSCIDDHVACLQASGSTETCDAVLLTCECEAQADACHGAGQPSIVCDDALQVCLGGQDPGPPSPCAEAYGVCMEATGTPEPCFVAFDACVWSDAPDAPVCDPYFEACTLAYPEDPFMCEMIWQGCMQQASCGGGACGDVDPELACYEQYEGCMGPVGDAGADPMIEAQCASELDACLQPPVEPSPRPGDACFETHVECVGSLPQQPWICDADLDECLAGLG